ELRLLQTPTAGHPIQSAALELQIEALVAGAVIEVDRTLTGQLTGQGCGHILDRDTGSRSTRFVTAGQENRHACQRQGYRTMGDAHEESFAMLVSREACPKHHRSTSQPTDYITNCFPCAVVCITPPAAAGGCSGYCHHRAIFPAPAPSLRAGPGTTARVSGGHWDPADHRTPVR